MEYSPNIIGRRREQELLQDCLDSTKPEFVAVFGRRRIGKTFLIKQFFNESFDFYTTGIYQVSKSEQLKNWQIQLSKYSGKKQAKPLDWFEAFSQLEEYLETKKEQAKITIFIDELPWLDTPKSNFLRALEMFWNSWASSRKGLKLVVCGSATTWMTNKLLGDKGGLHNRVTRPIRLAPFCLAETEEYLQSEGIEWERQEILDAYMILGGTPFYLSLLTSRLSLRQNIDELFFGKDPILASEYDFLFQSLFNDANLYKKVVESLADKLCGLTREELVQVTGTSNNGKMTEVLDNLIKCDFLRPYQAFGSKKKGMLYQLSDMYTLFYLRFVKNNRSMDNHAWSNLSDGKRNSWAGYAFEQVCILHINQIKQALGISGIASDVCSWRYKGEEQGAQIDLVIDRNDRTIDLCEIKYSVGAYELKKDYVEWLRERRNLFRDVTGSKKTLRLTMITSGGIKPGKYSSSIQGEVELADLFRE